MSQHDYDIANANGATVRADLNNALQAGQTQNSGATAPSTTYANMLWVDTTHSTSPRLLQRNNANSAWLYMGTVDTTNHPAHFFPHETATPAMTVTINAGRLITAAGSIVSQAAQTSGTITAPSADPRIDLIVIDAVTGAISIITGSEAASPSIPALTAGKIPVGYVTLATSTTEITDDLITDYRMWVSQGQGMGEALMADGSVAATAALPMGGQKITGGAAGTASDDFAIVSQVGAWRGYWLALADYDQKKFDASTQLSGSPNEVGMCFNSDGSIMYLGTGKTVYQYTLSTAWDVSTASYASKSLDVSSEFAGGSESVSGLALKSDGTTLFAMSHSGEVIYQYTLSTPDDLSTGSYASKSLDVSTQFGGEVKGLSVLADGSELAVSGVDGSANEEVHRYTLSTPWDLSTGSYATDVFDVGTEVTGTPKGLSFNADWSRMFVVDTTSDAIYDYHLTTAEDISSAVYSTRSFDFSAETTDPKEFEFGDSGTKLYVVSGAGIVYQFVAGTQA